MANILIVDDEKSIRITLREFLRDANYEAAVAQDADQAIEMLSVEDFDVVLADIILPRITGVSLLKSIREKSPYVQVILMTGEPTVETASEAVRAGAFDYLTKPINKEQLLKIVANAAKIKTLDDERRRLVVENRQHRENLEQLVAQRTQELRKTEQRLQHLLASSPSVIYSMYPQGNVIKISFVSERVKDILGYTPEETCNFQFWQSIIHPEDVSSFVNRMSMMLKQKTTDVHEYRVRHVDGSYRWLHDTSRLIFDKDGQLVEMIGSWIDITERVQSDQLIQQLNQAIEQSPVSVMITDIEGVIQYVNPKFSQVTGYSAVEAIGQNARLLQSGEHSSEFYQGLWGAITSGQEWRGEFHNSKKNGDLYWGMASIVGVKDQSSKITHYVAVSEDITKRKQREEEHVRQERLAAVGQLSAGIAHDFNNVMAVITLYSDLLQRTSNLSENALKRVRIIQQQAMHAADLTQQILDFSRRSIREPRNIDLKVFLSEMLKFIGRTIPENIQVQFSCAEDNYRVHADPTQLQQVATNLVVNARDAISQGGAIYFNLSCIRFRVDDVLPCFDMSLGRWIKLVVTDTGSGMASDVLPHIFEPFFTTKEIGKGAGLGLAQVYGIVQQHGGCITVESRLGEGTTFVIYLPALARETAVIPPNILSEFPYGEGETILLVEDNQILLEATRTMLESLNYEVITAENGEVALNVYRSQSDQIDLILADVVMPKMDGFQMVQALQQYTPSPNVLLMSGFPRDNELTAEMKQLVLGWLSKPLDIQQLSRLLREGILKSQ